MRIEDLVRMDLDDAGSDVVRIAGAIHTQLGQGSGPVPIEAIARALDIDEVRFEPLTSFVGALITLPERGTGKILVNANDNRRRQRFTIAHELGHFLSHWHEPTVSGGSHCSGEDLKARELGSNDRHRRQEAEANTFAIELLAPPSRLGSALRGYPDLEKAIAIADDLDISRQAAIRRYVTLHPLPLAAIFSHGGICDYVVQAATFPPLCIRKSHRMPQLPAVAGGSQLSAVEEADVSDWLSKPGRGSVTAQTLHQQDGYQTTLLHLETDEEENDGEVEDAYDRYDRFNHRD